MTLAASPAAAEISYHAPGIRHTGSVKPIPADHARYMQFVDAYGAFKLPLTRAFATRAYAEVAGMDWDPPSAADAAAMAAKAEAELPARKDDLARSRARRQEAVTELDRSDSQNSTAATVR